MPKLKAVVTITVWVLFIKGFINVVMGTIGTTIQLSESQVVALSASGIAALILACVGAWLRKKLE